MSNATVPSPAPSAPPANRSANATPAQAGGGGGAVCWHSMSCEDVFAKLQSAPGGLTTAQARERLAQYGPNVLPKAKGDGPLELLWRQINSPLVWVLIASAVVAMLADPEGGIKNGLVILGVVVLNTLIGFVQEYRAGKAIEALSNMVPENVTALRDGTKVTLPAADLVPGDVVMLASGDKVPADMRLFAVRSLQIEEAALTGESVPTEKKIDPVAMTAGIGDRADMSFGGTLVTYGTGSAVVVGTGANTELGKISSLLKEAADLATPLTKALASIGKYITIAIVVISVVMLAIGTFRAMAEKGIAFFEAFRETLIFAIALAVGAIPEGLPAIVTIALAIGVQRMAARRAVIRKLPAVETLGSTTTICSDKTGTLTRNEMTVQALWTPGGGRFTVTGVGYAPVGGLAKDGASVTNLPSDLRQLALGGTLCNDAAIAPGDDGSGNWKLTGDPTEGALVTLAHKLGMPAEQARAEHARLDAIPFESENQFMATLHAAPGGVGEGMILLKGAPEVILKRCTTGPGGSRLDANAVAAEVDALAAQGMRVLGFAAKPAGTAREVTVADTAGGYTLLGLQGMIDPPRPEAIEAIKTCHAAGITVKMITGDHKGTAQAIGRQLNILSAKDTAITGTQLAEMNDEQLKTAVASTNVFARVAPEHKLKLVKALQARDEVVAMTGDGVNDAPALKQSNIGVAMGITGTAVSKEAADIVLTDDNFASIAAAVEEGRRVYDNLIKSLAFVLPTNLGLAMILIVAVIAFPFQEATKIVDGVSQTVKDLLLPMGPTQLLWINLVATVALALPLAFEAKERDVMQRPPRKPGTPVLSPFVIGRTFLAAVLMTAGCVGLFLYEYNAAGRTAEALSKAQTMGVTTVIMFQIFYMLNCRSLKGSIFSVGLFSNKTVYIGIVSLLALQAVFIYAPFMHAIFGSAPLSAKDLGLAVLVGAVILPVISIEKALRSRGKPTA
ncbi:MAG: HAD-IC family P-type ATPase [Phycisphaerales bacterium]|nr:HAD-IC family P-type ATPase [Phycisphaerales bacterium]